MDKSRPGFALLLVLWVLASIALVMTVHTLLGRSEIRIAQGLRDSTAAEMAADDAVYQTVFRLIREGPRIDLEPRSLPAGDGAVQVALEAEEQKININMASQAELAALLHNIELDNGRSMQLAASIVEWREAATLPRTEDRVTADYYRAQLDHGPPVAPFESLDEIGRVIGMTPAVQQALLPYITIYSLGSSDLRFAGPVAGTVPLPFTAGPAKSNQPGQLRTLTITAQARLRSGGYFIRRAIVRLSPAFPRGFEILEWKRAL